jgi:competence protein ComEA
VGLPIDPNQADAATLETLPGIGPARALAIVEARPFRRIEDLDRVPGIGPRTLAGMAAAIAIGEPTR